MKHFGFLILYIFSAYFLAADEWDVFNNPETDTKKENSSPVKSVSYHTLADFGYNVIRSESLFDPGASISGYNDFYYRFVGEYALIIEIMPQIFFDIDAAFASSNLYSSRLSEYPSDPTLGFSHFSFNGLNLRGVIGDTLFVRAGILPARFGNGLLFNPVNYLARFIADPEEIGSCSFPGIDISLSYGTNMFMLMYLAYQKEFFDFIDSNFTSLFETNYSSQLFIAKSSHYLFEANWAIFAILELTKDSDLYTGIGTELQLPLSDFLNFHLDGLYSNGKGNFTAEPLSGVYYFSEDNSQSGRFFLDFYAEADLTLFSLVTVKVGYLFNQRGLTDEDFARIADSLKQKTHPNYPIVLSSAAGLAFSPIPFMGHLVTAGIIVPDIPKGFNINVFGLIDVFDLSFELLSAVSYKFNDNVEFAGSCKLYAGSPDSYFGATAVVSSIALSVEFFL
jgi:hypothetical protein